MNPTSKRYRRWRRNQYRRVKRICLARLQTPIRSERDMERRNRAAKILNSRVRYPSKKGYALITESVSCEKCGREVFLESDPCEWSPRHNDDCLRGIVDKWRRGMDRDYRVTDYWGGTATCCGMLYACQPDGQLECYTLKDSLP